jgi:hypothetical protein
LDELKENLIEIYHDINKGLVPDIVKSLTKPIEQTAWG